MIAMIPARGGSKGLPGKNIKELNGKPLIQYTIEAALASKVVDQVIVTTDDPEIAEISRKAGAEVPFLRPEELSTDTARAVDVYIHAAEFMRDELGKNMDKFMVLLATVPLRTSKHIDEAFELFCDAKADTLISIKEAENPPSWFLEQDENARIQNANFGSTQGLVNNRQVSKEYFVPNGAIYILDYKLLKEKKTYYSDNTIGYVMSKKDSVDIDNIDDFMYAEYLMKNSCKD